MAKKQLNSLDRFRKHPGRLILEEHGHCEVPAGCGGVVLRWRNPQTAVPVTLHLHTPVPVNCSIDGKQVQRSLMFLVPGPHVLTLHMESVDLSQGLLLFAAIHDPKEYQPNKPTELVESITKIVSANDGTWKFSLEQPASEEWMSASFDDQEWPALVQMAPPELHKQEYGHYRIQECQKHGAICLGLPHPPEGEEAGTKPSWWQKLLGRQVERFKTELAGSIWIRKVFTIPAPKLQTPSE